MYAQEESPAENHETKHLAENVKGACRDETLLGPEAWNEKFIHLLTMNYLKQLTKVQI